MAAQLRHRWYARGLHGVRDGVTVGEAGETVPGGFPFADLGDKRVVCFVVEPTSIRGLRRDGPLKRTPFAWSPQRPRGQPPRRGVHPLSTSIPPRDSYP